MILILLVFFLVTSFVIRMPFQERGLYIPTPENKTGRAQIVLQILDANRFVWIDDSFTAVVDDMVQEYGYLSQRQLSRRIINEVINRSSYETSQLNNKIGDLARRAQANPTARFFVQIRCPNEVPYFRVIQIITRLNHSTASNIRYGCVGGNIEDLRTARRISVISERDEGGVLRKSIIVDFSEN